MQQHPIPQDITGFEFKLIGDMTIKQFTYLAGCAIVAYLAFASPLHPLIKFPFVLFFALFGIALAFIPVDGRPLDRWITNFIKALFAPSQYIFHKEGGRETLQFLQTYSPPPKVTPRNVPVQVAQPAQEERLATFLQTAATQVPPDEEEELAKIAIITKGFEAPLLQPQPVATAQPATPTAPAVESERLGAGVLSGFAMTQPIPQPSTSTPPAVGPAPFSSKEELEQKIAQESEFEEENQRLKEELDRLKSSLKAQPRMQSGAPPQELMAQALAIESRLQEALSEKEKLASELVQLRQKFSQGPTTQPVTPTPSSPPRPTEKVHTVPPQFAKAVGVATLPQYPNIVSGVVKDIKGDVLPNIIVEVKDQTGNPMRAFKTNKVGQFSAATALSNGKYTIELEDPKNAYSFDVIAIELTGVPFQPLEIIAKDQEIVKKQNERQQLHQALFGTRN